MRGPSVNIPDPYKVLQVDHEAEDEVIEAAYRRLARKYHPDVSPGPESQDRMVRINQAWEMLRDSTKRAAVDRARTRSDGTAARAAAAEARARAASRAPSPAQHAASTGYRAPQGRSYARPPVSGSSVPPGWGFPGMTDPGDAEFRARPQFTSPNWTTGRSNVGSGYSARAMGSAQGDGSAGPPPGNPYGSVLNFGRYAGWSLGEIGRQDPEYLEWLDRMPIGRTYQSEIDGILRSQRRRVPAPTSQVAQRGLFRRR